MLPLDHLNHHPQKCGTGKSARSGRKIVPGCKCTLRLKVDSLTFGNMTARIAAAYARWSLVPIIPPSMLSWSCPKIRLWFCGVLSFQEDSPLQKELCNVNWRFSSQLIGSPIENCRKVAINIINLWSMNMVLFKTKIYLSQFEDIFSKNPRFSLGVGLSWYGFDWKQWGRVILKFGWEKELKASTTANQFIR